MLSITYAESHFAECRYAECRSAAQSTGLESFYLIIFHHQSFMLFHRMIALFLLYFI